MKGRLLSSICVGVPTQNPTQLRLDSGGLSSGGIATPRTGLLPEGRRGGYPLGEAK